VARIAWNGWKALHPRPFWARSFGTLSARIVTGAFAATVFTSLAVTWVSVRTTESFLHLKIQQKFPVILSSAAERLELGYSQRLLDVETFARSATVVESLARLQAGPDRKAGREEARAYLGYVLERSPQFLVLFALDARAEELVWVGSRLEMPAPLRARLAGATGPSLSGIERLGGRSVQLVSVPVPGRTGAPAATLHAAIDTASFEAALLSDDLDDQGGVYVVALDGHTLLRSPGAPPRRRYEGPPPGEGGAASVAQYTDASGLRFVGGSMALSRFDWIVAVEEPYTQAFAPVVEMVGGMLRMQLLIVLLFGLVGFQLARSIVRPIAALSVTAGRIARGEAGVEIPDSERGDEIGALTRAIGDMTRRLHQNQLELEDKQRKIEQANTRLATHNVQLQQMNEVLEQLSVTDGLTRLHNHRFFQDHLPREIERCTRTGEPLSLLLIDIDDFKTLNDRHGHAAGDVVLSGVAGVMSDRVRAMDLLARYGGEEFALLASGTDLQSARVLAEDIRRAIEQAAFPVELRDGRRKLQVTVSIGVATFKGEAKSFFADADDALYRAKRSGKNCVLEAS